MSSDRASDALVKLGAIEDLLMAMKEHENNASLIATCCNALWGLTILGKQFFKFINCLLILYFHHRHIYC
jgi:hypothetical protein